jgi:hypothetical protein
MEMAEARREFQYFTESGDPRNIFFRYKNCIKYRRVLRCKLKNPVNSKTGNPLKENTIRSYQQELKHFERFVRVYKLTIQLLVNHGYLGKEKVVKIGNSNCKLLVFTQPVKIKEPVLSADKRERIHRVIDRVFDIVEERGKAEILYPLFDEIEKITNSQK